MTIEQELKAYRKARAEITDAIDKWMGIDEGKCRGLFMAESIISHHVDFGDEELREELIDVARLEEDA